MPILVALFVASCVSYGWCIERRVNLGGPLVFIFGGASQRYNSY
jgi:hypothetical protein